MLNFTIRRIILVMLVALTVSVIAFFLVRLSGDLATALAGEDANAQEIADIKKIYGLDRPLIVQYADWLLNALRGDFGASLYFPETVGELVAMRLPTTPPTSVFRTCCFATYRNSFWCNRGLET